MTTHHLNNGHCPRCLEIMDRYPNMDVGLKGWFVMFQARHPEAHVSCAGRGFKEQQEAYMAGKSLARYTLSAHNWNCAIDVFCNLKDKDIYDLDWFNHVLAPEVPGFLNWYGVPGHPYHELPHLEVAAWHGLRDKGLIWLVEEIN